MRSLTIRPPRAWTWLARPGAVLLVLLLAVACTIQLAPPYDRTIVDGLTAANEQTLTLFAGVASGGSAAEYPRREPAYNAVIGKFDALRIQAKARPTPPPPRILGDKAAGLTEAASIGGLEEIVRVMTRMRDDDKDGGMNAAAVSLYKGSYEISIDQVLTYEKALAR